MGIGPIRTELHGMAHSIHSWVQWLFIEDVLCAEDFQRWWAKSKVPVTCCSHIYSPPLQSALFQVTGANPTDYISLVTSLLAGSLLNSANESTGGAWRVEGREKREWACFSLSPSPSLFFRQCLQQTGISSISPPLPFILPGTSSNFLTSRWLCSGLFGLSTLLNPEYLAPHIKFSFFNHLVFLTRLTPTEARGD